MCRTRLLTDFDRIGCLGCRRHRQQRPGAGEIGLASGAGEEAAVPNAVKPLRQDVLVFVTLTGSSKDRLIKTLVDLNFVRALTCVPQIAGKLYPQPMIGLARSE